MERLKRKARQVKGLTLGLKKTPWWTVAWTSSHLAKEIGVVRLPGKGVTRRPQSSKGSSALMIW